jgi:hypothetical protein
VSTQLRPLSCFDYLCTREIFHRSFFLLQSAFACNWIFIGKAGFIVRTDRESKPAFSTKHPSIVMKNESLIASGLYGTWTFATQTMADIGYYKGRAYVVMHLMPDPVQVPSCQLKDCSKQSNQLCQHNNRCVNTNETVVAWSDGKSLDCILDIF